MLTLFNGQPVPQCPRPFVVGVDRLRGAEDLHQAEAFRADMQLLMRLSELPNTPFSGRFGCGRRWH